MSFLRSLLFTQEPLHVLIMHCVFQELLRNSLYIGLFPRWSKNTDTWIIFIENWFYLLNFSKNFLCNNLSHFSSISRDLYSYYHSLTPDNNKEKGWHQEGEKKEFLKLAQCHNYYINVDNIINYIYVFYGYYISFRYFNIKWNFWVL